MSSTRSLLLGTLAYAGVTFPLAYSWHLVAFADLFLLDFLAYGLLMGWLHRRPSRPAVPNAAAAAPR